MAKRKSSKRTSTRGSKSKQSEANFQFALNAAILAVMIAVLMAMVSGIGLPTSWFSKALTP